jgi:hypothetical protein
MVFDSTKFKLKYVLGSGSFGVVTFAEYTDVTTKKITFYALKSLSKATVIETGEGTESNSLGTYNRVFVFRLPRHCTEAERCACQLRLFHPLVVMYSYH